MAGGTCREQEPTQLEQLPSLELSSLARVDSDAEIDAWTREEVERWTHGHAWANEARRAAAVAAVARQETVESRQEAAAAVPWPFEESERQCSGRSSRGGPFGPFAQADGVHAQICHARAGRSPPRNLEGIFEEMATLARRR